MSDRPRRHRLLVPTLLALAVAVVAGLLGLVAIARSMTERSAEEVRELVRKIREAGEPVEPAEAAPPRARPEENAAPFYRQAFAAMTTPPADVGKFLAGAPFDPEKAGEAVDGFLASEASFFAKLARGAALPRCDYGLAYSQGYNMLMPHLADSRKACQRLRLKARRELSRGEADLACGTLADGQRFLRSLAEDPILICLLVKSSCESMVGGPEIQGILDSAEPSEPACRGLLASVAELHSSSRGAVARVFATERAMARAAFALARRDRGLGSLVQGAGGAENAYSLLARWGYIINEDEAASLRIFGRMVDAGRKPGAQAIVEAAAVEREVQALSDLRVLTKLLLPTYGRVVAGEVEAGERRAVAIAALGLRIHRLRHGTYPGSLAELVPSVLPAVPVDPRTGRPLEVALVKRGFEVAARQDDGKLETRLRVSR